MSRRAERDWIVAGGAPSEWAHCRRCGDGLVLGKSQRIEVGLAAMKAFAKIHARCRPGQYRERPLSLESWPASRDTGVSSATIFYTFTGSRLYDSFDVPHDPSDLGRCYRLLKLAPAWEARLLEVAERFPKWVPFAREWPKLTAMYERALADEDGREMYEFMRALAKDGGK